MERLGSASGVRASLASRWRLRGSSKVVWQSAPRSMPPARASAQRFRGIRGSQNRSKYTSKLNMELKHLSPIISIEWLKIQGLLNTHFNDSKALSFGDASLARNRLVRQALIPESQHFRHLLCGDDLRCADRLNHTSDRERETLDTHGKLGLRRRPRSIGLARFGLAFYAWVHAQNRSMIFSALSDTDADLSTDIYGDIGLWTDC